jgi:ribonuclease G
VNSGSFVGRGKQARLEDTITKTNIEAAVEVVNQLRLRDIGGIIVIDFIDMARVRNSREVMKTLRASLDEDRTKTFTAEISKLGLVEMTRQNVTEGVREIMTRACPTCDGEGVIKSEETIAIEVERWLRDQVGEEPAYLVRLNPRVTAQFTGSSGSALRAVEADTGKTFYFEGSEGLPLDHMAVTARGTQEEIAEQAVPFSAGDEVYVHIIEPHMYNVDDAVAKIDSYLISVTGGYRYLGDKRLVRIDEVGRTAATATVIDVDSDDEDDTLESGARRRGRRGGRRRSRAKAESASE